MLESASDVSHSNSSFSVFHEKENWYFSVNFFRLWLIYSIEMVSSKFAALALSNSVWNRHDKSKRLFWNIAFTSRNYAFQLKTFNMASICAMVGRDICLLGHDCQPQLLFFLWLVSLFLILTLMSIYQDIRLQWQDTGRIGFLFLWIFSVVFCRVRGLV